MNEKHLWVLRVAWLTSIAATLGSLYFSEIANYPPCVLCWYQRICMYPLVAVLGAAVLQKNKSNIYPALVLAVVGWVISVYHNLLYFNIIPESGASCEFGVSCTTKFIEWFGFVTIPFLAFVGFTTVIACLIYILRTKKPATV